MPKTRLDLQFELETLINSTNVKFQPKSNVTDSNEQSLSLKYPCILYSRVSADVKHADNKPYRITPRWQIVHISKTFNEQIIYDMLEHFPMCTFDREYKADNLYHHIFYIYY